jgi:hypothetical protein
MESIGIHQPGKYCATCNNQICELTGQVPTGATVVVIQRVYVIPAPESTEKIREVTNYTIDENGYL